MKKGEIYKARLPKRGNNEADSVIVVMAADRRKGGLELRVIQAYGLDLPAVDEPLWLITHGQRVVEGTVTAVKPAHDVTPPPYYSGHEYVKCRKPRLNPASAFLCDISLTKTRYVPTEREAYNSTTAVRMPPPTMST